MIGKPYDILLVDDDMAMNEMLNQCLIDLYGKDVKIQKTCSPLEAMDIIQEGKINIAIVDITMPEMLGDEFLRRAKKFNTGTEYIISTADTTFSMCASCFFDGATSYLRKPYKMDQLERVINISISKFELWEEVLLTKMKK